jgi:GLPGLI family protein
MQIKMGTKLLLLLLFFATKNSFGQHVRFITSGLIEYEKSINMYALTAKSLGTNTDVFSTQALDDYKKANPQFKKLKSSLIFSKDKTLFTPKERSESNSFADDPLVKQINTIFTDLATGTSITHKEVYEDTFLVKDSVRKINWKITDENRVIAGFACRRANAVIMDSIYVVAFYSDQIPVSGGPESFTGLPGMIFGLALPHESITWFATTVTELPVMPKELAAPSTGKVTDNKGLNDMLAKALKDWGNYAKSALKAFSL